MRVRDIRITIGINWRDWWVGFFVSKDHTQVLYALSLVL